MQAQGVGRDRRRAQNQVFANSARIKHSLHTAADLSQAAGKYYAVLNILPQFVQDLGFSGPALRKTSSSAQRLVPHQMNVKLTSIVKSKKYMALRLQIF
jgi:hypothetical protein